MPDLTPDKLAKLRYINLSAVKGRTILLTPLWDGSRWTMWIPIPEGKLLEMHPLDTVT